MANALQQFANGPWSYPVDTSLEAAAKIEPAANVLREKVLRTVAAAGPSGSTVLEMAAQGYDRHGIQPRFSELRTAGKIVDSGMRRRNPSGVRAIVWVLPEFASRVEGEVDGG
ncbi:hypothetical protein [Sphingomonas sp.]|uniref:hypothetical protein n=1 Tax=Sphingomonas sp. TaxID=28214 RepID=UPI003BACFFED